MKTERTIPCDGCKHYSYELGECRAGFSKFAKPGKEVKGCCFGNTTIVDIIACGLIKWLKKKALPLKYVKDWLWIEKEAKK